MSKRIKIGQQTERDVQAMLKRLGRKESVGEFTGKLLAGWVTFHTDQELQRHTFDNCTSEESLLPVDTRLDQDHIVTLEGCTSDPPLALLAVPPAAKKTKVTITNKGVTKSVVLRAECTYSPKTPPDDRS